MTITITDASLIVDARNAHQQWCVYEHHAVLKEGEPPTCILVGACRSNDVFHMIDGKTNSEWTRIFEHGGQVLVRIVAFADTKAEAVKHATETIREKAPLCNLRGFDLRSARQAIKCLTNGHRYDSQLDAARALDISQGQLSRHLRGETKHVKGLVFAYAPPVNNKVA